MKKKQIMSKSIALIVALISLVSSCSQTKSDNAAVVKINNSSENRNVEERIEELLTKMSLEEKIGQTAQRGTSSRTKVLPEEIKEIVRKGGAGSLLNVTNRDHVKELQRIAVEESPHGIPLIFARDVIHGFKTIFPIPLGQAATFNPKIVEKGARIAAIEASSYGIRWTFAPMLDIARDPRWGRIAESSGEDPYLTSKMAEAYIRGFQGENLSNPTSIAACAKHFVGYGAAEGGRDYNTAIINEHQLHNVYFRPFKTAVEQGVATFMTSFNELNGVPASGNSYILKTILRDTWGFDGFVVSDWNSITEMIPHGFAQDEREAALKSANAGLDMEMTSKSYDHNMADLIAQAEISEKQLDDMVRNILRIKFKLGLFENPYFDPSDKEIYAPKHIEAAQKAATESIVLLKNEGTALPISSDKKIAIIGQLADAPHEQLGTWTFDGEKDQTQTPLNSLQLAYGEKNIAYCAGYEHSRDKSTSQFKKALKAARKSDVILFFGGEEAILSGEAHSRANIDLPGAQEDLIHELSKLNKPIVLVVLAGRPITFKNIYDKVDAILFAWHPGTMGGPAIADLIQGKKSPSGRLPVTWPKEVGQIPLYYNHKNTGRPASKASYIPMDKIPVGAWQSSLGNTSHYLDAGFNPMFPFGYGLSYTSFSYDDLKLSTNHIHHEESLTAKIRLSNTGNSKATETVQLYVQDISGSITRPVKELLQFKRVSLDPGESKAVSFKINTEDLSFYSHNKIWEAENGSFNLWIGANAGDERHMATITLDKH